MERRTISFRNRTLQILFEVLGLLFFLGLISMLALYFLYSNRIISVPSLEMALNYDFIENSGDIDELSGYLNKLKVDYVISDVDFRIKKQEIDTDKMIFVKESLEKGEDFDNKLEKYVFRKSKHDLKVVIRIPMIPEFTDRELREKYDFHSLFNKTVIAFAILFTILPFIHFIRDIRKEFYILNASINSSECENKCDKTKITEINYSVSLVEDMKKKLVNLIDIEKKEKEDLLFQISSLSHDLKTPLTIIKGNVDLLECSDTVSEKEEYIGSINKGIDTIEHYMDEMILYSKWIFISSEKASVYVREIFDKINEEIEGFNIEDINFRSSFKLSSNVAVFCSKKSVERAVINILVNAFRYAKTQVNFNVSLDETLLRFEVYNDGKNLSKEVMENIGKLFYTENSGRNNEGHYGLGLYFAKTIAEEHGGDLKAKNIKDGVIFIFRIKA